jgi:hypothetical protein
MWKVYMSCLKAETKSCDKNYLKDQSLFKFFMKTKK